MSTKKEIEMTALARKMDLFTIVYVGNEEEAYGMAKAGADVIIAHAGCTIGGSIGVTSASVGMTEAVEHTRRIITAARKSGRKDLIFLSHGGPILTPEDAAYINQHTDTVGFVGASSLERIAVEQRLPALTREFKAIPSPASKRFFSGAKAGKAARKS